MDRITAFARAEGIRTHLDGARIFLQAGFTGRSVAEYARMFDTVYVSLYKYFNAPSGAILAGPRALLDEMFHTRRMFGGGLARVWPFAAIALHYFDGFSERYAQAVRVSNEWKRLVAGHEAFCDRTDSVGHEPLPAPCIGHRRDQAPGQAGEPGRPPAGAAGRWLGFQTRRQRVVGPHDRVGPG